MDDEDKMDKNNPTGILRYGPHDLNPTATARSGFKERAGWKCTVGLESNGRYITRAFKFEFKMKARLDQKSTAEIDVPLRRSERPIDVVRSIRI